MSNTITTILPPLTNNDLLPLDGQQEREEALRAELLAASGVGGIHPLSANHQLQSERSMSVDGSANYHSNLTAPPFPSTAPVGSLDLERSDRLLADVQEALAKAPKDAMQGVKFPETLLNDANPYQAASQVVASIIHKSGEALNNVQVLEQFLRLNLKGSESKLAIHSDLLEAASKTQEADQKRQIAKAEEAAKAAEKAAAKQAKAGIFQPLIAAVVLIVSAVLTVATLGMGTPAVAVLASAALIGVMAGAIKGAVNGNGFDFNFMMEITGYALAVATLGASAGKAVIKEAAKKVNETFAKEGWKAAAGMALALAWQAVKSAPGATWNMLKNSIKNIITLMGKACSLPSLALVGLWHAAKSVGKAFVDFFAKALELFKLPIQQMNKAGMAMAEIAKNVTAALQTGAETITTAALATVGALKAATGAPLETAKQALAKTIDLFSSKLTAFNHWLAESAMAIIAVTEAASEAAKVGVESSVSLAHNEAQQLEATAALIEVLVKAAEKSVKHENEMIDHFQEIREKVFQSAAKMISQRTNTNMQIGNSIGVRA